MIYNPELSPLKKFRKISYDQRVDNKCKFLQYFKKVCVTLHFFCLVQGCLIHIVYYCTSFAGFVFLTDACTQPHSRESVRISIQLHEEWRRQDNH